MFIGSWLFVVATASVTVRVLVIFAVGVVTLAVIRYFFSCSSRCKK